MKAYLAAFIRRYQQHRSTQHFRKLLFVSLRGLFFLVLILVGLMLTQSISRLSHKTSVPSISNQSVTGLGAGNSRAVSMQATFCNPLDPSCFANSLGASISGTILSGLQPVTDFFQDSTLNILTQTPADDTYANPMIERINQDLVTAVDVALACLLLIGGYNVMVGHHLRLERASLADLLPRAILATCAVHFNLPFLGLFIDLNNALCRTVIAAASGQTLTNIFAGFFSINPLAGMLLVLLIIILALMALLLLLQMITRLALVAVLIAVAPLALACFVLPQTTRWGRLWLSTFSASVLVQFLQVTALALSGMLITALGNTAFWHIGHELGQAFLTIGMLFLTLKIPGMLQTWSLNPMMAGSAAVMDGVQGALTSGDGGAGNGEAAAKVAELIALL